MFSSGTSRAGICCAELPYQTLKVRLHRLSSAAHDQVLEHLCAELNESETAFPGTDLRLVFEPIQAQWSSTRSGLLRLARTGETPCPTMLQASMTFRPSRSALATTSSDSAPGLSQSSSQPCFVAKFVPVVGRADDGRRLHSG